MLYRICKRLIERGQTAGLAEKIDVFYALGRITEAEYKELTELLEGMGLKDTFNAETVGGWVSEIMGCIPFVGARFETDHLRGMVTRMEKRRVTQVRIWRKEGTDGHAAQA